MGEKSKLGSALSMAKLEIKKVEGTSGLDIRDYQILIDGHQPTLITGLELGLNVDSVNHATVTFVADEVQLDGEFTTLIRATVEVENEKKKGLLVKPIKVQ